MKNYRLFFKFLALLLILTIIFAFLFRNLKMNLEGESFSVLASFYWVITTMTTVGYGDIIFTDDTGRFFTIIVLTIGVVLIFIGLPYIFISFIIGPWIEESIKHRIPRYIPKTVTDHVIICGADPIALTLVEKLKEDEIPYYIVIHDLQKAETLFDDKLSVCFGDICEDETYDRLNITTAKIVFANQDVVTNTHITLTIRQLSDIPVIALVEDENSKNILKNAGATHILSVKGLLGQSLSNRTMAGSLKSSIVGNFDKFEIAKIPVYSTPFEGKSISSLKITENTNVRIVGVWERADFLPPEPDIVLTKSSILVLMGEKSELLDLDECLSIYHPIDKPIIVIGAGAVGLSVASDLDRKNASYVLIDKDDYNYQLEKGIFMKGDAARPGVLESAGITDAPSVAITTHDDGMNNYLTIHCRMLNKDICIICRANNEKNLTSLYKAGADFVVPYNMIGSNMVYNIIYQRNLILRTEGLSIFEYSVPSAFAGKTFKNSRIREQIGCNVICLRRKDKTIYDLKDNTVLDHGDTICMIGTTDHEHAFFRLFNKKTKFKSKHV